VDINNNYALQSGMTVYGSDGEKIGDVDIVERDYFVVRKGFFFPEDHYIPFSAIQSAEGDDVYLSVTKDDALNQNWTDMPSASTGGTFVDDGTINADVQDPSVGVTDVDTAYVGDDVDRGTVGQTNNDWREYDQGVRDNDQGFLDRDERVGDVDGDTIEVREENLEARTREVDRGAVRVDKHVVEEQQSLDVPVTEEEVHVSRRAVDRPAGTGNFEESTFEIPVRGEEVEVSKNARVVEEIDIDKSATQRTEHVTDTVRREEVDISGTDLNEGTVLDDDRSVMDKAKDALTPDDEHHPRR